MAKKKSKNSSKKIQVKNVNSASNLQKQANENSEVKATEKRKQKNKNSRKLQWAVVGLVILALASLGVFLSVTGKTPSGELPAPPETEQELVVPSLINSVGSFAVGSKGQAIPASEANDELTRMEVIFDVHCPACKMIEDNSRDTFNDWVENDDVQLWLTPVTFLDNHSTDNYSSRASSALIEVAENSPEYFLEFQQLLFEKQPATYESYVEVSNEELAKLAESIGVPKATIDLFKNETYVPWLYENTLVTDSRSDILPDGISTPTVLIGGTLNRVTLENFEKVLFNDNNTDAILKDSLKKAKGE